MRLVIATSVLESDLVLHSANTLVLLVSYASSASPEGPGAMVLDQYEYGPRRVYALARLVSHEAGWGVDGVTVVPYVAVGTLFRCTPVRHAQLFCRLRYHHPRTHT